MAHPFLVKDVAFQAGLSTATVDRVLNGRGGVRRQTMARVHAAIAELERLGVETAAAGRGFVIDVVMEAPERFTREVRAAFESEAAAVLAATFRSRFHLAEKRSVAEFAAILDRIRLRGSHGVVVKGPDVAPVSQAVDRLAAAGVPVATLVTDLPRANRIAYAGCDNRAAGETAAWLIGRHLGQRRAAILVTLSSERFQGEDERRSGFRAGIARSFPHLGLVEVSEGYGHDRATGDLAGRALDARPDIAAVYSIGGANRAIVAAFADRGRACLIHVAHDLDDDNRALLADSRVDFVLHHDLKADIRALFRAFLAHKKILPAQGRQGLSAVEIVTRFNTPAR